MPPLMFTATEALALVMAVLEGHEAADPEDPVGSALGKIVRVLPEPLARPVDAIRRVTARGWDVGVPDVETTAALVQASADQRRVRLTYRLGPDRERDMDIDPWAVVVRHRRWYVLGWSHTKDARRVLRVDRVARVSRLPESFTPPADLDPLRAIEEQLSQGWRYEVEVEIDAARAEVEHWLPRSFGRLEALGERRTRLVATTDEPEWYAAQLAGLPFDFRLVDSPEIRAAMDVLARRLRRCRPTRPARNGPSTPLLSVNRSPITDIMSTSPIRNPSYAVLWWVMRCCAGTSAATTPRYSPTSSRPRSRRS